MGESERCNWSSSLSLSSSNSSFKSGCFDPKTAVFVVVEFSPFVLVENNELPGLKRLEFVNKLWPGVNNLKSDFLLSPPRFPNKPVEGVFPKILSPKRDFFGFSSSFDCSELSDSESDPE